MKNRKTSKKFVVEHASNDWTKGKIQAAYENGYLKYEELSQEKRIEIDKELATMFVVCTPALVKYVMDCQMGLVDSCFFEIEGNRPVLIPAKRYLELFTISMRVKKETGFVSQRA